jgi:cystathionine beta-lyase
MSYDFDQIVDRRGSDSFKWSRYGDDVLPMWVADLDFRSPQPVLDAICRRVDHGVFGYSFDLPPLREAVSERMLRRYNWQVSPDEIIFLPGLVSGINIATRAIGDRGDGMLVQTPVYPPFLAAPANQGRELHISELRLSERNGNPYYETDDEAFEAAIQPNTRLFMLCNPHNPVGRAFTPDEQLRMAEICARHDLVICSDEIHSDLLMGDTTHMPMAALYPEIGQRTITLLAPSKTYNIPALGCSMAIIQNPELRQQFEAASRGIVPHVNVLGFHAALAAYTECDGWLAEMLAYLTANRDFAVDYINKHLPGVRTTAPEATYLAWLDCRDAGIKENPHEFFLREAGVALNDGAAFGPGGEGFVRLNFGCPRATLEEGLGKMREAWEAL